MITEDNECHRLVCILETNISVNFVFNYGISVDLLDAFLSAEE